MPKTGKPNIVVIWGDDIAITNLSCYSDGMMGYRTPNIDRIAHEGVRFADSYGEQSCTRDGRRCSRVSTDYAPG
jgi:arylsulfatase A-like enzyme